FFNFFLFHFLSLSSSSPPQISFSTVPGYRASWGWRSFIHGRELLRSGLRWQVGSVQLAYEVARGKFQPITVHGPVSLYDEAFWNKVWPFQVQPKLRIFLWKIFRGILPTRKNLAKTISNTY
ncbi:hypothetical protein LINPERPRIM_LOCUS33127, partial [Linum perenne]